MYVVSLSSLLSAIFVARMIPFVEAASPSFIFFLFSGTPKYRDVQYPFVAFALFHGVVGMGHTVGGWERRKCVRRSRNHSSFRGRGSHDNLFGFLSLFPGVMILGGGRKGGSSVRCICWLFLGLGGFHTAAGGVMLSL